MTSSTLSQSASSQLAQEGGPKAFPVMTGTIQPKLGVDEFLSIAERFGFSPEAMERLSAAVSNKDLPEGGPHLGRYYGHPKPIKGEEFEALGREKFAVKHALGVSSGTAALHCAMVGSGAALGREVICAATGFVATGMAAALAGATPVFCDVDESLMMDPLCLEALINPKTVAIAPTHHWGAVCDMEPILEIARKHHLRVIEDCAQSPGATYRGQPVGSLGDFGCYSISCYKIIGGGEGGMVVTNDDRLFDRACQMAEAGGLWRQNRFAQERYPGELFVGANYRLSELEAAVNVVQFRKLDDVVSGRRTVSQRIRRTLEAFHEITWQKSNDPEGDIGYLLRFFPSSDGLAHTICKALAAEGINAGYRGGGASPDWHLFHDMFPLFPEFRNQCQADLCPVASDLFNRCININLNPWWSPEDCTAVATGINKVLSAFCTRIDS